MLYDIGFGLFSLFYLPALICKGKLHGDFAERFAAYRPDTRARLAAAKDAIWIQAVSVGEVALCRTLIPLVRKKFPGSTIVLSTITKTGNDLAKKLFAADGVIVIYFPLDFTATAKKAASLIRPKAYIMIETEIWPNVLKELSKRGVPTILINGRISDRSFGSYKAVRAFLKKTLGRIGSYHMQSALDAERIRAMGAPADRVSVTGNMKYDLRPPSSVRPAAAILDSLGVQPDGMLLVAGSTHPGEEEALIDAYRELLGIFPGLHMLIAPRHIDRAGAVEKAVGSRALASLRVSALGGAHGPSGKPVLILDTIGKLGEIYSAASLVFIGGSLVPHGGQNPLEPAMFGKAVIFGPHMFNFKAVAAALIEKGGAIRVKDAAELRERIAYLLGHPAERDRLGANARLVIAENRGASERCVEAITLGLFSEKPGHEPLQAPGRSGGS